MSKRIKVVGERKRIMSERTGDLPEIIEHPDCALAVPTTEHFLPLYYLAGLCDAAGEPAQAFLEGGAMGSLTMTSYGLGLGEIVSSCSGAGAGAEVPASVPPEQTNL